MNASYSTAQAKRRPFYAVRAFTLVELVVAVAIVVILVSLLLPAITMVRNSVRRAKTVGLIDGLTAALEIYALEDGRRRFPAVEADQSLRTNTNAGGAPRTLDLLRDRGSLWRNDDLDADGVRLVDAWRRPVHYVVDDVINKVIDRPAVHKTDWNPKAREPFGYVWSLGRPSGNDAADADPTDASRWLYHGASK